MDTRQADPMREGLRQMWASVAPSWRTHADFVDARGAAVTAAMLAGTSPCPGDRVLELACGPGGVGLSAAERVRPGGEVVLSDLTAEMADLASARAAAAGHDNVRAQVIDAEDIDEPDGSFDVVVCREGLMLVPEPARAVAEMHRVLRPGGRAAVAVWGARERNPWLGALFDGVTEQTGFPVPPPGVPGPFSLDSPDALARLLSEGGFADVVVDEVASPVRVATFDDWWAVVPSLAGPVAQLLDAFPAETVDAVRAGAERALDSYGSSTGYQIPGLSLVASGRRG